MTTSVFARLVCRVTSFFLVSALLAAACSSGAEDEEAGGADPFGDPGECVVVDAAVSSEKIDLMKELAEAFNRSDEARQGDRCYFVRPHQKASGAAMELLAQGWPERLESAEGPRPVIWSPAASTWGPTLNHRLSRQGKKPMVGDGTPFMLTPLVIAMPKPMAEALGWPEEAVGWRDVLELARGAKTWADFGHPEWGEFRLGKTNPNFSTSGLAALVAQVYAALGKTSGLSSEDLTRDEVRRFAADIESSVVHYGDTTLTFLQNWYLADRKGTALNYASAAAVEEKSVIDYNRGNPDGVLEPGEEPRPPRIPLVAVYPEEGTLYSDNPMYVLDADWVSAERRRGAELFTEFVLRPENQRKVLEFGFRPGNPEVRLAEPISARFGVDPDEPQTLLEVPSGRVLAELLDFWASTRKRARVLLLVDVSGSMADEGDPSSGATKLDLAKRAAVGSLDQLETDDQVGLRVFTTGLTEGGGFWQTLVPVGPIGENRDRLVSAIEGLRPLEGTPLYAAVRDAVRDMLASFDEERINAVVVLSDGRNELPAQGEGPVPLQDLVGFLERETQGEVGKPVRVFTIAYGTDADRPVLERIAAATAGRAYDASDPRSIEKVLAAVVSNF